MDPPMGSVEFAESDELERLRRRAYGPDADIAGDVAAQARLSELEAAQRRQSTPVVDAAARVPEPVPVPEPVEGRRPASTSVRQPVDGAFAEHAPAGGSVVELDPARRRQIADSDLIRGAPAAPWWRRRRWWANLGGAVAGLALIATHVAWTSQLLAREPTPIPTETETAKMPPVPFGFPQGLYLPPAHYILALETVGADARMPDDPLRTLNFVGISPDELRRYEDFQELAVCASDRARSLCPGILNVWSGESRYGMTCLFVAVPGQGPRNGYSGEGCSPEGFDTIAELPHLGGDGFIRFVLRGDQVNVYVYERPADPIPSEG
ncbi:MAG TPA: hypothetical protein VEX12_14815 [Microbacterium sp.]|nr:hypothetical protein [Microbacterium sp.]